MRGQDGTLAREGTGTYGVDVVDLSQAQCKGPSRAEERLIVSLFSGLLFALGTRPPAFTDTIAAEVPISDAP